MDTDTRVENQWMKQAKILARPPIFIESPEPILNPTFTQVEEWIHNPEREKAFFESLRTYEKLRERIYKINSQTDLPVYSGLNLCEPAAHALAHAIRLKFGILMKMM